MGFRAWVGKLCLAADGSLDVGGTRIQGFGQSGRVLKVRGSFGGKMQGQRIEPLVFQGSGLAPAPIEGPQLLVRL